MKPSERIRLGISTIFKANHYEKHVEDVVRHLVGDVAGSGPSVEKTIATDSWDPTKYRDPRAGKKGIGIYRDMDDNSAVISSHTLLKSFAMSGFTIEPGRSEDMERSREIAEFFKVLFKHMSGTETGVIRDQMLDEALKMGYSITEDVWKPTVLPGYGQVMGLDSLKVRPAETFWTGRSGEGGIISDKHGNIIRFEQEDGTDYISIEPKDLFHYAFQGSPSNPYGRSTRFAAYSPYKGIQRIERNYDTFCMTTASGIKELQMPDEDWENDALVELTRQRLEKLAPNGVVMYPESWKLKLNIPPGTAGEHFIRGISKKESGIRASILTVDSLSVNEGGTDGYASVEVREQMAHDTMQDAGVAFLQSFAEYIIPKGMIKNGYDPQKEPWPVFLPTKVKDKIRPAVVVGQIGDARQKGVFTKPMKEDDQLTLMNKMLDDIDMKIDGFEQVEVNIPEFTNPDDDDDSKPDPEPDDKKDLSSSVVIQLAGSPRPKGRTVADVRRDGKTYDTSKDKAKALVTKVGTDVTIKQVKAIEGAIFKLSASGKLEWKLTRSREIRKALEDNVTKGQAEMHKSLISMSQQGWNLGQIHSSAMVGGSEKVQLTLSEHHQLGGGLLTGRPKPMTRAVADDWIWNNTYQQLKKTFTSLDAGAWQILDDANRNEFSAADTSSRLRAYFEKKGLANLASTGMIIDTTYATVYNMARVNLWDSLADPSGTIPGGVNGYFIDAILDDHTSDLCESLNDKFFKIDDPSFSPAPYHPWCRTVNIPVMTGDPLWGGGEYLTLDQSTALKSKMLVGFGG